MTFQEAFTIYFDYKTRAGHRELTLLHNHYMYQKHVAPFWDDYDLDDIDRGLAIEYFADIEQKAGIANARAIKKFLAAFFNFCVDEEYMQKNPCHRLPLKPYKAKKTEILTKDQTQYLLSKTRKHRLYPHLLLLITTGVRHGEMAGLQWQDIDFTRRTIRLDRAFSHSKVRPLKTAESYRTIDISTQLVSALRKQQKLVRSEHGVGCPWVFPSRLGKPLAQSTFNKMVSAILADLGLPHVVVHSFRHYHTTYLFAKDKNPVAIKERLGWGSVQMLLERYAHVTDELRGDIITVVDDMV